MNKGNGPEKLQQIERLSGSDFAEENPVRPMPQSRLQKVPNGHGRRAVLLAPSFEAHEVPMGELDFLPWPR